MYKAGRLKIQNSKGNFVFSIVKYENAKKFYRLSKHILNQYKYDFINFRL